MKSVGDARVAGYMTSRKIVWLPQNVKQSDIFSPSIKQRKVCKGNKQLPSNVGSLRFCAGGFTVFY